MAFRHGRLALAVVLAAFVAAGCSSSSGGDGGTSPDVECVYCVAVGVSDEDGFVTVDLGDMGTFTARVRDGLTQEAIEGANYVVIANPCETDIGYVVTTDEGYQIGVFVRDEDDVMGYSEILPPPFWDEVFPWVGGTVPQTGVHGVFQFPVEIWDEFTCSTTLQATDAIEDMDAGNILSVLPIATPGIVLATAYPAGSDYVLVYACYCEDGDEAELLSQLKLQVYLEQGYCETQDAEFVELDGPCDERVGLGLPLIEPAEREPGCTGSADPGSIGGYVIDAVSGYGISGATVTVGGIQGTSTSNGSYSLSGVPSGDYVPLLATATGHQPFMTTVEIPAGGSTTMDITLVPSAGSNEWRFVLNWGQDPWDLDSHLWVPLGGDDYYRVCFWDLGSTETVPYAQLDTDDVTGFGPETVTVLPHYEGEYVYAVNEFSGSGTLATSGAVVRLYHGNDLVQEIHAPTAYCEDYWWWRVGTLNVMTGHFTLQNEFHSTPPVGYWRPLPEKKTPRQ
jgi:hypothetical protein